MKFRIAVIGIIIFITNAYGYNITHTQFKVGEYLEHEIKVFGVKVAIQKVWIEEIVEIRGYKCYKVKVDIETLPWFSTFYHLHDVSWEYIDVNDLCPVKIYSKIKEGKWTNTVYIEVDKKRKIFHYKDKRSDRKIKYKDRAWGLVSLVFWLRAVTPKKGEKFEFLVSNKDKLITVKGRAVDTDAEVYIKPLRKKFKCYYYKQEGKSDIGIWISKDKNRLPVRMLSVQLKVAGYGLIKMEALLRKYKYYR